MLKIQLIMYFFILVVGVGGRVIIPSRFMLGFGGKSLGFVRNSESSFCFRRTEVQELLGACVAAFSYSRITEIDWFMPQSMAISLHFKKILQFVYYIIVPQFDDPKTGDAHMHKMEDDELFWRALMVPLWEEFPFEEKKPKVAFMLLTKRPLPLRPLWKKLFHKYDGFYSIYVHSDPSYIVEPPESSVFYKRKVSSKQVQYGKTIDD